MSDKKWLWLLALVQRREGSCRLTSYNKYVLQAYTTLFVNTLDGEEAIVYVAKRFFKLTKTYFLSSCNYWSRFPHRSSASKNPVLKYGSGFAMEFFCEL
jgi:hypothetical protein